MNVCLCVCTCAVMMCVCVAGGVQWFFARCSISIVVFMDRALNWYLSYTRIFGSIG